MAHSYADRSEPTMTSAAIDPSTDDGEACGGPRRWAEGLPFASRRELRATERASWRRRCSRLVIATVATTFGVGGTVVLAAAWLHGAAPGLSHAFGGGVGIGLSLLGGVGVLGLCLRRWPAGTGAWTRIGGLVALALTLLATALAPAELASSLWLRTPWVAIVLLGTGTLALAAWHRITLLARLPRVLGDLRRGDVDVYANASARLEVLPSSKLVLGRNGAPSRRVELTRTAEIASPQPHAYRTDLPRGIVRASVDSAMRLQRRSLTSDERAELGAHIQRLRRAAWPTVASLVAVALVLSLRMLDDPDWHNLVDVVAFGWYALGVVACVGYARRHAAARKLEIDRDLRWVVTVDDVDAQAGPLEVGVARLEVLPVSHLAWTEDAAPAPWRLHGA
jgi:hypothetical protein